MTAVMLSAIMLTAVMLTAVRLTTVMLSAIMMSIVMLSAIMLTAIMLSVAFYLMLCWMSICWASLCYMLICWASLWRVSFCWMSWRLFWFETWFLGEKDVLSLFSSELTVVLCFNCFFTHHSIQNLVGQSQFPFLAIITKWYCQDSADVYCEFSKKYISKFNIFFDTFTSQWVYNKDCTVWLYHVRYLST